MERPSGYNRFTELIEQPQPLTDEDVSELRGMIKMLAYTQSHVQPMALMRANLETIDSIRRFDRASGELVSTTNLLTEKVRKLTVLGVVFAGIAAILAGWALWLTWLGYQVAISQVGK